jgi:hypothetical protein
VVGYKKKNEDRSAAGSVPAAAAAGGEARAPAPAIAAERLEALLASWLTAQNEGGFAAYVP